MHTHKQILKREQYHHNPNYKIKFTGLKAYHIPQTRSLLSPCMDPFWTRQPMRQGKRREED